VASPDLVPADANTTPPGLHEFESELMELLWELGECNVRAALEELNRRSDKERKYTTVMTTMARLDKKGLLVRRREGKADFYTPTMTREEYLEARAAAEVGALVANYGEAALVHFARQMNQLDPKRREQLRRLAKRDAS
jgi:predicted transcriptional regulator